MSGSAAAVGGAGAVRGCRVLVVEGGWQRGTLSAVRSLGRAGHTVTVASEQRGLAARSRRAAGWLPLPPVGSPGLVPAVAAAVRSSGAQVVFAGDDEHLLVLSERRGELGALLPGPPHDALLRALDKPALYEVAAGCGIAVPETRLDRPEGPGDGWLVKQRVHAPGSTHAVVPAPRAAVPDDRVLYQRVARGPLLAVVALAAPDGRLLHLAAQRAETLYPEPFGVSARARTVPLEPALGAACTRLLRALGWSGLAELQFIVPADGPPLLIDLNARWFGSLALQLAAGADLPRAWLESALTGRAAVGQVAPGRRYQWLEGDLRRALAGPDPAREVLGALRFAGGAAHSISSLRDPGPALALAGTLGGRLARRLRPAAVLRAPRPARR